MKKLTNEEILTKNGINAERLKNDKPMLHNSILVSMSQAVKQRDEEIKEWIDKNKVENVNFAKVVNVDELLKFIEQ